VIDLILIILIHISRISLQQTRRTGRARALTAHLGCQQGYSTAFNIARQDVQPVMSQEIPRSTSRRVETLWSGWTIWSINIHQMYVNIILTHIHIYIYIYIWLYLYNSIPVSVSISHDAYICISVSFSIWDYIYIYVYGIVGWSVSQFQHMPNNSWIAQAHSAKTNLGSRPKSRYDRASCKESFIVDLPVENCDFHWFSIAMLVYQRVKSNRGNWVIVVPLLL